MGWLVEEWLAAGTAAGFESGKGRTAKGIAAVKDSPGAMLVRGLAPC